MKKIKRLSGLAISLLVVSCTKKSEYDYALKEQVESKANISEEVSYLYTPSITVSSRSSAAARPYWQGESKLLKARFTEKSLQFVESDSDGRFDDNEANKKLVLEIPITNLQYECAKDQHGECTNKEADNAKLNWAQKSSFKMDLNSVKFTEANILPLEMEKLFGSDCYTELSSKSIGYKLEKNVLNFQLEKTFRASLSCLNSAESLSDLTVTAIYHYSVTDINQLISKNYEPVKYPREDESTFGFFTTDKKKLDVDFSDTTQSRSTLLNRWNPNRKQITYYLSKEFEKPENQLLKEATIKGFEKINLGLEQAGVNFRLNIESANGKVPGDNRYSFIILVEDPIASSILGYGPTVADPRTGEIVSGRVVMYPGVMKQYIKFTYEQLLKDQIVDKKIAEAKDKKDEISVEEDSSEKNIKSVLSQNSSAIKGFSQKKLAQKSSSQKGSVAIVQKSKNDFINIDFKSLKESISGHNLAVSSAVNLKDRISLMSKYCNYPADMFNFQSAMTKSLSKKLGSDELMPWEKLDASLKQSAIDIILPEVWIPTLVHEMGHNLGLRHNFKGSEDKKNFYTEDELHKQNIDVKVPYSSVMDYPYTDLNMLPSLGKYDIAALKFGYLRSVEDESGQLVKIEDTLANLRAENKDLKLKDYDYCTDENVDVNVGCKRFDEGTTYTEMAQHAINTFEAGYQRRSFRNGRGNFSLLSDAAVIDRQISEFNNLRFNFEIMSRLKNDFGLEYDAKEYEEVEWLKDLKQASLLSARFLMDVLTTPDKTCVVADKESQKIAGILPISTIGDKKNIDCKAVKLNPKYEIVAEFGKNINSKQDPNANYPGKERADQIDVKGFWLYKVAAFQTLFARSLDNSIWDKTDDNFYDIPELREELNNLLVGIAKGELVKEVEVKFNNGDTLKTNLPVDFTNSHNIEAINTDLLNMNLKTAFPMFRGTNFSSIGFQQLIVPQLKKNTFRKSLNQKDYDLIYQFSVQKLDSAQHGFGELFNLLNDPKSASSDDKLKNYYLDGVSKDIYEVKPSVNTVAEDIIKDLKDESKKDKVDSVFSAEILDALSR